MKKLIIVLAAAFAAAMPIIADTETVGGFTWTYRINGDTVEIYGNGSAAISPKPTGTVTIPSTLGGKSVTSIGREAFYNCSGLTSVTIPDSVTNIGYSAFFGCSGLTSVTLPFVGSRRGNSGSFDSVFGYIFGTSSYAGGTQTRQYYSSSSSSYYYIPTALKTVTITDETVLGYGAFYGCSGLTNVTIPDSVTNFWTSAFFGCSGLMDVTVPFSISMSSVFPSAYQSITNVVMSDRVTSIGDYMFRNCSGLTSVTIPDSVMSIGRDAFSCCSELLYDTATISGVTLVDGWAIGNTGTLSEVLILAGVRGIGASAFSGCSGLTSVTIGNSVTSIGEWAFENCSGLTSVTIPNSVTSIGREAFSGCSGLTSVNIPNSVTNIGSSVFYGCSGLEEITLPFVGTRRGNSSSSDSVFGYIFGTSSYSGGTQTYQYSCYYYIPSSLKNVVITDETVLGYDAFYGCSGLTSVTIPDSVTNIGDRAFYNCSGLTSVTIPDSVTSIGPSAFYDCSGLTSVTIGNSVTSIGEWAFGNCRGLTSVMIPDSVTSIGYCAFYGCSGMIDVTIPNSITNIGIFAFSSCKELKKIVIPDSVISIGEGAFGYNIALETVVFNGKNPIKIETKPLVIPTGVVIVNPSQLVFPEPTKVFVGCPNATGYYVPSYQNLKALHDGYEDRLGIKMVSISDLSESIGDISTNITSAAYGELSPGKVYSNWNSTSRAPLEVVVVGNEEVEVLDAWNDEESIKSPYFFTNSPAVLVKTIDGGWKLILDGINIGGRGIQARGDLAIELLPGSANHIAITAYEPALSPALFGGYGSGAYGINVMGNLLIFGFGSLTINNSCENKGDACAGIEVGCWGWYDGNLIVSGGSVLNINTVAVPAIHLDNGGYVSFVGSMVSITGGSYGIGMRYAETVGIVGAVVNMLTSESCIIASDVLIDYATGTFVSRNGYDIYATRDDVYLGNSIVSMLSEKECCIRGKGCSLESGTYKFAINATNKATIVALDSLIVQDAAVECCSPDGYGIYFYPSDLDEAVLQITSGYIQQRATMDIKKEFLVGRAWSDTYGMLTSGRSIVFESIDNPYLLQEGVLGAAMLEYLRSFSFSNQSGQALCAIYGQNGRLVMSGGAIWPEASKRGIQVENGVVVTGGSLKGPVNGSPVNESGQQLVCYTNAVDNYTAYGKVVEGWDMALPSYYKTDSLYADETGNVYFWVPGSWNGNRTLTVTFDANGGYVSEVTCSVANGAAIGSLPMPTLSGYTFVGWFTALEGGTQVTETAVVEADVTYYAHWIANGGGGSGGGSGGGAGGGSDGGSGGGSVTTDPVTPCYEMVDADDIETPYEVLSAQTVFGAVYRSCDVVGIVELKLGKVNAKKKSGKISGTLTDIYGKKHKIASKKLANIDDKAPLKVQLDVKDYGTMDLTIGYREFAGSIGKLHVQSENVGNDWGKGTATVKVAIGDLSMFSGKVVEALLPTDGVKGAGVGKWSFEKAPSVKWTKLKAGMSPLVKDDASGKGLVVGEGSNPSGMKLMFTAKKGTFKGSFKVHALEGAGKSAKLKKYTVKVTGVVVDGVGYGVATCKKPAVTWSVTVE